MQGKGLRMVLDVVEKEDGFYCKVGVLETRDGEEVGRPHTDIFSLRSKDAYAGKILGGRIKMAIMEEFNWRFF